LSLKEIWWQSVDCVNMTQNRGQWFGEHGNEHCGYTKVENFLNNIGFSRRTLVH